MDFWRTVMVLVRRWYVTGPAILLTLGASAAAYSAVPDDYESVSILVLTTPLTGGDVTPVDLTDSSDTPDAADSDPLPSLSNPLLNFDRSLALTASILIQQLNSAETAAGLGITPGSTTDYEVTNGSSNPELLEVGPFVFVQGHGPSPEAAQEVTEEVVAMAHAVLEQRQADLGAPPSTHIDVQVVVAPTTGQALKDSPLRAAAATGALAGLAALVAVFGFESLSAHRRRRPRVPTGAGESGRALATAGR